VFFHFLFMWFFAINGFLYVLYTFISGEWRQLLPNPHSFKEAWLVLLHDLHIRKMLPPQDKYNAAQRIAYTSIIVMGFGSLITGLAIYKPAQFYWLTWVCGGYHFARILHFALTIGYVLFFVIHIVQVIIAGWNNFRSVISGFEVVKEKNIVTIQSAGNEKTVLGFEAVRGKNIVHVQSLANEKTVSLPEVKEKNIVNIQSPDDEKTISVPEVEQDKNTVNFQNPKDEKTVSLSEVVKDKNTVNIQNPDDEKTV